MHKVIEDLDATNLQLGEEFQTADCLMISEVMILLDNQRSIKLEASQQQEQQLEGQATNSLDVLASVANSSRLFTKYKNKELVGDVRRTLASKGLARFEIAQIGNLLPETAEEAKSLIPRCFALNFPSLTSKMDDDELQKILDDLSTARRFQ